jgi:hypothetical protein
MTFIPQVLTQIDNNNTITTTSTSFTGTSTDTTGFNTIILTIQSTLDSSACGIQVQFSSNNSTWTTYYTDTYFNTNVFTKKYLIINKYYRINYTSLTSANFTITSRLSTDLDSSQNTSVSVFDNNVENTLDAFGKLRVTNPTTILDIRFPGNSTGNANFLSNKLQVSNTGNGSYIGDYQNSRLIISATGAGYYISQSKNYCVYQPGKSLLFMASGVLYPGNTAYTTRIGYFNYSTPATPTTPLTNPLVVKNGLYFQHNGGNYSINISNNSSTFSSVNQSSWNIDKMNGTGPSGLTLDFTKAQLFVIDMEWLGIGRVRFGFYAYGKIQYCHQVTNINGVTLPYTSSINLPICYSIHNNSATVTSATAFTQICSTVISEGGFSPVGRPFSVSNSTTLVQIAGNVEEPILFLRGGSSNYNNQNIIPTGLSIISTTANNLVLYKLVLFLAGTYGGTQPTWSDVNSTYSVAQYAGNLGSGYNPANGIILDEGYFYGRGSNTISQLGDVFTNQVLQLTSNITGLSDILVLTATYINTTGTTDVYGTLSWQEFY